MNNRHPLQKLFEAAGLGPRAYSGRRMFGQTCVAIVVDRLGPTMTRLMQFFYERGASEMTPTEVEAALGAFERGWSQDQMGMGLVLYFPNVPFVSDLNPEEDEHTELEDDDDDEDDVDG